MALETKFYLDELGLQALVAKIKALHQDNADEITRVIEEIIGSDATVPGSLREQIQGILDSLNGHTSDLAGIDERLDKAIVDVNVENDIDNQTMTLTFTTDDGTEIEASVDTSEFIVNGILQDAQVVTGDKFEIVSEEVTNPDDGTTSTEYKVQFTDKNDNTVDLVDQNVIGIVFPDYPASTNMNDKAQFLLLTFGVKPDVVDDPDPSVHEPDAQYVWVNLGTLITSYTFRGDLNNVDVVTDANNVVTISLAQALKDTITGILRDLGQGGTTAVTPSNEWPWDTEPTDDGLKARVEWLEEHAANLPIDPTTVDAMFNDPTSGDEPTPEPEPEP